ncbi:MAG: transcriptional regulator [Rhizobiales bacterium]|nr:transcriptional regulator [Hyphomicrobiales bacterium]
MSRDFTPREIEVFAAVMLHGTTTKAADSLEITQPAVSKALMQIADKAGFKLFQKTRQRLVPTPEAHMLYAEIERVFETARTVTRAARDIRELRSGRLEVCALPAFGLTLLPRIIAAFSKNYPAISIGIDIRSSVMVIQRAARNQLDLGIGSTLFEDNPSITRRSFISTPPVCVMPVGHPLARLSRITVADLEGVDFISLGSTDPTRRQLDRMCEEQNVNRNNKIEARLSKGCIDLVAAGAGVSVVDRLSAWMERDLPIVIREFEPTLELNLSIYKPWGITASAVTEAFTTYLLQESRAYMHEVDAGIRQMSEGCEQVSA